SAARDQAGSVHAHFFGQSPFATYVIGNERNVVKVPDDIPLELLGPLGCGLQTGAGAVINSFAMEPGTSLAVFGAGAVGLAAVMAAKVIGASSIVAVDLVPDRLTMAKELGATHMINPREQEPIEAIRAMTGGGADYSLDTTGRQSVFKQAVD